MCVYTRCTPMYEGSVVNNRTQVGLLRTSTHIIIHGKIIQKFPRTEVVAKDTAGEIRPMIGSGKLHASPAPSTAKAVSRPSQVDS